MWIDARQLSPARRDLLERTVRSFHSLQDVVRWGFSASPPRDVLDVVVQDEFSHDVVLAWEAVYLAFDTT